MIPTLREQFNSEWSPAAYERVLHILERQFGEPPQFRISETPCFLPRELLRRAGEYGEEIVDQLLNDPHYMRASCDAVPAKYKAPNDPDAPLFVQADFGLDENRALKLVEIQGFPSLYGYQPDLSDAYREGYRLDATLRSFPDGIDSGRYETLVREAIVGAHDPENVALLELDPWRQKTRHDFTATQRMSGIAVVDARDVIREGNRLYYDKEGERTRIKRIYNRVIADELERKQIRLPFDFSDDLDVEWAGHPNWFFRLSKFSLPFVNHPAVPASFFVNRVRASELNLQNFVLKPLYSFAGAGVVVGPALEDIQAIPEARRGDYVLQERVNFQPVIATPEGRTKVEVRVMYIRRGNMTPVNYVLRMGRGAQMGVDFNKGFGWVGASAAFIPEGE